MKSICCWLLLALVVITGSPLLAQSTVKAYARITISAPHDGLDTQWYNLFIDGKRHSWINLAGWKDGWVTFVVPEGLPPGEHVIRIEACSDLFDGSSPDRLCSGGDPWVVYAKVLPSGQPAPVNGVLVRDGD